MFEGVNVIEDVSYGQRGYLRNQEGLLNMIQKHLERYKKAEVNQKNEKTNKKHDKKDENK